MTIHILVHCCADVSYHCYLMLFHKNAPRCYVMHRLSFYLSVCWLRLVVIAKHITLQMKVDNNHAHKLKLLSMVHKSPTANTLTVKMVTAFFSCPISAGFSLYDAW